MAIEYQAIYNVPNSHTEDTMDTLLERQLVRKLDTRLLPFLSNAVLDNFEEDVHITPDQFNTCITIFYVGFLLFQIPSNVLLKRFTAKRWLPALMFLWGIMATLHSTVTNYTQLLVYRLLLGVFESGFFPGVIYYLTLFYKKNEMATRIALFWGSTVAAHAFAGILAYGILQLRGARGLTGWQWLFLIEGIPTIVLSLVAALYLPASPEKWTLLTDDERSMAIQRLQKDSNHHLTLGDLNESNKKQALKALTDWKVWMWMLMFFCGSVPNTSISNFLPSIVKGMGYDNKLSANLMSAPPYLCAVFVMIGFAYSSDKRNDRAYHAIVGAGICLIGYILLVSLTTRSLLYFGVCIAVSGIFVINPVVNAWLTSNIAPDMKKNIATAMAVSANNSAGLLGSNIYRKSDAPRYLFGHTINLIFLCVFIILALVQRYLLLRINKKRLLRNESIVDDANNELNVNKQGATVQHINNVNSSNSVDITEDVIEESDGRIGDEADDFIYRL
ncbi:unnamed protein product [Cunninghamella blakesleeana]